MSRVKERGRGLELRLRPRRVEIKPKEKRHEYIRRLERAIETLEAIIKESRSFQQNII